MELQKGKMKDIENKTWLTLKSALSPSLLWLACFVCIWEFDKLTPDWLSKVTPLDSDWLSLKIVWKMAQDHSDWRGSHHTGLWDGQNFNGCLGADKSTITTVSWKKSRVYWSWNCPWRTFRSLTCEFQLASDQSTHKHPLYSPFNSQRSLHEHRRTDGRTDRRTTRVSAIP